MKRLAPKEWVQALREYSDRNIARPVVLEEDSPEFGAQIHARSFKLSGVAYDPHDDRVEIMLARGTSSHLTHSISHPTHIDLDHTGRPGREVLRIEHSDGQTLLSFQAL
jgi:hypothetical protein